VTSIAVTQLTWRLVAGGLAVASAVIVSARLGLATQGVVATSISVLAGLSVATGAGFSHAVAFAVARQPSAAKYLVDRALALTTASGLAVGVIVAALASLTLSVPVLWWHVAVALPFFQVGQLGLGLQQGMGSTRGYLATYVAPSVCSFAIAVVAATVDAPSPDPSAWSGALVLLPFVVQACTVALPWRNLPRGGHHEGLLRSLLSYTTGIYPSTLAHYLSYRLDLIVVSWLLGAAAAGLYSLALNGVDAVARIGQTGATLLFPRFAADDATAADFRLARRTALVTGTLSLAAVVVMAALALAAAPRLGQTVHTLGVLLLLLAIGGGAVSAWTVLASYFAARGRLAATARINAALLVVSVLLYFGLIPVIGLFGGAIGTTTGLLVAALLGYWEAGRDDGATRALREREDTRFKYPLGK
jgi:O-antigen/teichoic acid export membrane protein